MSAGSRKHMTLPSLRRGVQQRGWTRALTSAAKCGTWQHRAPQDSRGVMPEAAVPCPKVPLGCQAAHHRLHTAPVTVCSSAPDQLAALQQANPAPCRSRAEEQRALQGTDAGGNTGQQARRAAQGAHSRRRRAPQLAEGVFLPARSLLVWLLIYVLRCACCSLHVCCESCMDVTAC